MEKLREVESWVCQRNRRELGKIMKRDVIYGMSMEQMKVRWKNEYRVCMYVVVQRRVRWKNDGRWSTGYVDGTDGGVLGQRELHRWTNEGRWSLVYVDGTEESYIGGG